MLSPTGMKPDDKSLPTGLTNQPHNNDFAVREQKRRQPRGGGKKTKHPSPHIPQAVFPVVQKLVLAHIVNRRKLFTSPILKDPLTDKEWTDFCDIIFGYPVQDKLDFIRDCLGINCKSKARLEAFHELTRRFFETISWALLSADHFTHLAQFISKLKIPSDQVSRFISDKLPKELREELLNWQTGEPVPLKLQKDLINELNKIIQGDLIYSQERFQEVKLRAKTKACVEQMTVGGNFETAYCNRLLLEDAFLQNIKPVRPHSTWVRCFL